MITEYFNETSMIATGVSSLSVSRLSHDPIDVLTWISSGSCLKIDLSRVHEVGVASCKQAGLTKFQWRRLSSLGSSSLSVSRALTWKTGVLTLTSSGSCFKDWLLRVHRANQDYLMKKQLAYRQDDPEGLCPLWWIHLCLNKITQSKG